MKLSLIVAIYADESIKVLYPNQGHREDLLNNEIKILKKLNGIFQDNSEDNGIVRLIDSGIGIWQNVDDAKELPGFCTVIIYTYGEPLFPVLMRLVQSNARQMIFWYFSKMVSATKFSISIFKYISIEQYYRPKVCIPWNSMEVFCITISNRVFFD